MNYKPRHNMSAKSRPKTTEEEEGMARMMKAIRKKRERAVWVNESVTPMAQHEDVKNR